MTTNDELNALKKNWSKDPCWDIEKTEGFEEHHDELLAFRKEQEARWEAAHQEVTENRRRWIGEEDRLALADFVRTPEEIEATLSRLDHQVKDWPWINFEISRAQVRASLLIAIQIKRVADALETHEANDIAGVMARLYKIEK